MKQDERSGKPENLPISASDCSSGNPNRRAARHLLLYVVYAEILLVAGIKVGAFHTQTGFSETEIAAAENSFLVKPPPLPAKVDPLPSGILFFDQETNQVSVTEGEAQAKFLFNLHNASGKPLIISNVVTSCGCTVAKVQQLPWLLKPGDKGEIAVTMDVQGYSGRNEKQVTIYTDKGAKALQVIADIPPAKKAN